MNYDIAKKLKEAGFPQLWKNEGFRTIKGYGEISYIPTLEELIEACGKPLLIEGVADYWISQRGMFKTQGKTPSEAVANLWLELNKKTMRELNPEEIPEEDLESYPEDEVEEKPTE